MKRFYLVDIENVGKTFLKGAERLTADDVIVVCHNKIRQNELSPVIADRLAFTKATVKKFYITSAMKNAMDFELVMELGFLIAQNGNNAQYYIISNDKGFDIVNDYMKNKGLSTTISRITTFEDVYKKEMEDRTLDEQLQGLLPEFSKKTAKIVYRGISESKSPSQLHNYLQIHLKRDYTVVYPRVKHLVQVTQ